MSQTNNKYPHIRIFSEDPNEAPTGANTGIELNGEKLPGVSFVKAEFHARRMTKVLIEMYAHVEIDSMGELETKTVKLKPNKKR